jgi:carbon-monoxide dehydrogenase large subunit
VGEAGCIGVPAALLNAARDALQLSVQEDIDFPLTSEKLWSFLRRSKGEEQR